ncbi:BTAD domain-containing putative transcriptional regulator [Mycolicibacter sp. MYC101]|nr:BTAD domain-containing putative transcriptional regulator [Mycolicibacter sp. MYC101]MEB3061512.1 BTAD domain-containing putative transcriptional regulator [Mycolicibacter sp. MYC101]
MLGLHGGSVVSAESLIDLLWGDDAPRTAVKALQTHISALRRALGDGFVITEGMGWILSTTEVDASRYKLATKTGRDAVARGDIPQAVASFDEALALWRGTPELPDSRRGLSEKTRWLEGHAAMVEDRADALLATGRAAELIGELEAAVGDAPLRERRWGQLMLALYRAGRQGEALGAYQRARSLLADELGVDPGPELRRLEAAIVAQDTALEYPVGQHPSPVTRAVTFLLTDIEGSTAAWEADANAMAIALARHDELAEQVVTSRGGRLIKTRGEGDATFSVFERPSAAAAAALELQDAILHEPWALREPMRIRIALHTGEVELRDGDYFGRAVNRAARLRSLAVGGQILCSGATAELVIDALPDDVMLADLGMRQLRNLPRPEHVFELRLEAAERPEETSDAPLQRPDLPAILTGPGGSARLDGGEAKLGPPHEPGPFVGRSRELERLASAWQTTLTDGIHAVLIAGEPGIGKTRLAGEWSRQAYEYGAVVLYGRSDEDLGAPYQPFAEALRSLVPCVEPKRLRGLRGLEALLSLVPGLADVLPDLVTPPRADPDTERYALFDAAVALLELASANAPVVLILDDLHWAAKPTLLLLRHLLRFGDHTRLQVVATYRSTDLDRSHPLAAMLADLHRDGTADRLQLSGLDEDDVTAYVTEAGHDDEELAHALASVTGGNPFFLIEALRHVAESGGVWDPSTLPQGVREAVSRRLSRLPAETNKALAAAAVVGSRFALELVERVVDQDLVDAFDQAGKAGILIEESGGRYRFNHAIVRQSLLAELPSVRRMRLHQRIATTLEAELGADDELLAELAYHYFECAWAGNAAKAVEYCRRAADQAMARLAYEGAADLYDHALHALDEIDEELPDRGEQAAELLIARCEALLAAGDVASAAGAVAQLQVATIDSDRLAAWATCFDGQLSMLIHPERLDDVEVAVGQAAVRLAEIADASGEAKAHTVRAGCLARLGRIGDCEDALDDALTAARRAGEHRRVNAVLANAPLAALWGPNPVPRAGGRCLDVVRLLRITTDSPAVEATSTRCQALLEAFRGRTEAARRMIDSARRTITELGLRHALLEVEQFAGMVELVADDPGAAEPHLRKAYHGFRRMGLDADTAETAALLGRACLALDRDAEAAELCSESERLAGHALKASISWRTLRALLLARRGEHDEARRMAQSAVGLAERTDLLVDHGDACLALATVLRAAGDAAGARAAAEQSLGLYERKGAGALADMARLVLGEQVTPAEPPPADAPAAGLDNACVRAGEHVIAVINREAWDEVEQLFAPDGTFESRRKIVGFGPIDVPAGESPHVIRRILESVPMRVSQVVLAIRGERVALARLMIGTADVGPGSPQDEFLILYGIDKAGRVTLQVWFDLEDMDPAITELEALHAGFEGERAQAQLENAAVRASQRVMAAVDRGDWDAFEQLYAPQGSIESRRKVVGFKPTEFSAAEVMHQTRQDLEAGAMRASAIVVAVRGERLALARVTVGTADTSPGAPRDELLQLYDVDDQGRITHQIWFDVEDMDAAIAELDALHARFEADRASGPRAWNKAALVIERFYPRFAARDWDAIAQAAADNYVLEDRRRMVNIGIRRGRDAGMKELLATADVGFGMILLGIVATRGERLVLTRVRASGPDPATVQNDALNVIEIDSEGRVTAAVVFDVDDFDAAIAELDARYVAGEAAAHARTWLAITGVYASVSRHEFPALTPDCVTIDHRRVTAFAPGELPEYIRAGWDLDQTIGIYVEVVHRLSDLGAVCSYTAQGVSREGFDAEWREIAITMVDGDMVSRCEMFDEADLDTALARFEELDSQTRRLENAASRLYDRFKVCFAARDWRAIADMMADNVSTEDRRRTVNAGLRQGPDAVMAEYSGLVDFVKTFTSEAIATRGDRLVLSRARTEGYEAFITDFLDVVEVGADGRGVARVSFDADDITAAIEELDARYLAGEAAAYAHTWSVITRAYGMVNRHEIPPTTPDFVDIDHRRFAAVGAGDLKAYLGAALSDMAANHIYVEAVHQLTDVGAVVTHAASGTSQEGFDAAWRITVIFIVDGELLTRCEMFDEADLHAALTRFDELSRAVPRLENAASRAEARFGASFATRDWDTIAELLADDSSTDDRRPLVGVGARCGRDVVIADWRATADVGVQNVTSTPIATRGERLVLSCYRFSGHDQRPEAFRTDVLGLVELDAHQRIESAVMLDLDEIDAAFSELDARYLAGEAAAHAHTWSVITDICASFNRYELPAVDWINVDHRHGSPFASSDLAAALRSFWDLTPQFRIQIETVHRLSDLGAVITHYSHGTSLEGTDVEWRMIQVLVVEGDRVTRCELFDESDVDAALARFEELHPQPRRLENAASQMYERFKVRFAERDWRAITDMLADNVSTADRRRVVNAGLRRGADAVIAEVSGLIEVIKTITSDVMATRGTRLALNRTRTEGYEAFHTDLLNVIEIDADKRLTAHVAFEPDDFDAAIAELDARYLAGEAAAHAHTWSVITDTYATFNRYEMPAVDWVNVDHRRGTPFTSSELAAAIRSFWDLTPKFRIQIEAVHRLSDIGAVITHLLARDLARRHRCRVAHDSSSYCRGQPDHPLRTVRRGRPRRRPHAIHGTASAAKTAGEHRKPGT